jgi:hypothetical protein
MRGYIANARGLFVLLQERQHGRGKIESRHPLDGLRQRKGQGSGAAAYVQHTPLRLRIHNAQERADIIVVVIPLRNLGKQRRAAVPVLPVAHRRAGFAILAPQAIPVKLLNGQHRFYLLQGFESEFESRDSSGSPMGSSPKSNRSNGKFL